MCWLLLFALCCLFCLFLFVNVLLLFGKVFLCFFFGGYMFCEFVFLLMYVAVYFAGCCCIACFVLFGVVVGLHLCCEVCFLCYRCCR